MRVFLLQLALGWGWLWGGVGPPDCCQEWPGDEFAPGWRRYQAPMIFAAKDLYGYIDGGAELFFEFGFSELTVQRYRCGERELSLDLYRMTGPDAALAVYLAKKGEERPTPGVEDRNTGSDRQITALRGRWFIQVNNQSGEPDNFSAMIRLLQGALQQIPLEAPQDWLRDMPADRIPGSELLVAGPLSLQMVYTLGEGDILQLQGNHFGVCVERPDGEERRSVMLRVDYADTAACRAAFAHVQANLDAYLVKLAADEDWFTFRDYKNEYGRVVRSGRVLEIWLNLRRL
ncbi:hypothetical protein GX408_11200 [bacterium]|nr:hypothetical protein [bacterium]